MKLLYLPNEGIEGDQYGPRLSLASLKDEGLIEELNMFSYCVECKKLGNWDKTLSKLLTVIERTLPSTILVQHIGRYDFSLKFISGIKRIYSGLEFPLLAYDEGDVYGYLSKPVVKQAKLFCKNVDVIFLVAAGDFAQRFRRMGCKNVHYLPSSGFTGLFTNTEYAITEKEYDIVMIGNNSKSRIPFLSMPGVKERERLAVGLQREFHERFALFGNGWDKNPSNHGPLPFPEQGMVMNKSWIRIDHDHFTNMEGYFSNRLPITLLSGVPYVCRRVPGLENLLVDDYHCRMYDTVSEGINICKELLAGDKRKLIEMGLNGSELALDLLTDHERIRKMVIVLSKYEQTSSRKIRGF
ncbi:MAG: hypothetical protein H0S79_07200 [Anaerolineaceae bacterium]|nr:hypothetical protein [Anaerolineaceae bacterium]